MTSEIRFTLKEQGSILNLLGSIPVRATDENAIEMVELVQSIKRKVILLTEEPTPEEKAEAVAK